MTDADALRSSPIIVRAPQLAELIGVHRSTVWRWEQAGTLPPRRRFGPQTSGWLKSEIAAWVESRPVVGVDSAVAAPEDG